MNDDSVAFTHRPPQSAQRRGTGDRHGQAADSFDDIVARERDRAGGLQAGERVAVARRPGDVMPQGAEMAVEMAGDPLDPAAVGFEEMGDAEQAHFYASIVRRAPRPPIAQRPATKLARTIITVAAGAAIA